MPDSTFSSLEGFMGKRAREDKRLKAVSDLLDELPFTDTLSVLTFASQTRSKATPIHEAVEGNRFHISSEVSPHDFHWLEGIIFDTAKEVDFVELSPLQPFGINHALAGTNQKNIISALRRSEVNADATTALFREALGKYRGESRLNTVRVGSNVRTVRAQIFDANTSFLPHFKVFGEVTVGKHSTPYGSSEISALVEHLGTEVDILDTVATSERSQIQDVRLSIGNLALLADLATQGRVDLTEARKNTTDPEYSLIGANNLDMPEYLDFDNPQLTSELANLGFSRGLKILTMLKEHTEKRRPDLLPRLKLHLGRVAGMGYYRHLCYKIDATNNDGVILPLADGGTTDWAKKATNNKQLFSMTSGIGTELVCKYFIH